MAELDSIDPTVRENEASAEALAAAAQSGHVKVDDAKEQAAAIDSSVEATRVVLPTFRERVKALSVQMMAETPELVESMRAELTAISSRADVMDLRLRKAATVARTGRQMALHRAYAEYEALRMEVAAKLRVCIETAGGKADDLFDAVAADKGEITKASIHAYLAANQPGCELDDEKLDLLFPTVGTEATETAGSVDAVANGKSLSEDNAEGELKEDPEGSAKVEGEACVKASKAAIISREAFNRVVRIFYKVVKEIVLSNNLLIEQSEQLRRLDVGEVMEVFQGPMLDPSVGVYRIHGRSLRDGITGWVTVAGNQGVTFLMPGGGLFKVVRQTMLTDDLKDVDGSSKIVAMLKEGQILEVIDWGRTSRSALGVTRLKVKVQGDEAIGWVSIVDSGSGVVLLEAI